MEGKQVLLVYHLASSNCLCLISEGDVNLPHPRHVGHGKAQYLFGDRHTLPDLSCCSASALKRAG